MSEKLHVVFSELEVKLAELKKHSIDFNQEITQAIKIIEKHIFQIQEILAYYNFESTNAEINYFKIEYPKLFRLYYFYQNILFLEKEKYLSIINFKDEKEFYSNFLQNINFFYKEDLNMLREYSHHSFDNEKKLFLRKHYRWRRCHLPGSINDTYITNAYSTAIGKRDSLNDLIDYIENKIKEKHVPELTYEQLFNWTDNKCDLIELAYALYTKESLNNGNIELVGLIRFFERHFNIKLNNHHSTIQELKQRKKERTKYIDALKLTLDRKLLE